MDDLSQLLARALKQPELLKTDSFRRRFSRLVRHELAEPGKTRLDVLDQVERSLEAAAPQVAETVRELLSISLMPTPYPAAAPGLAELLAALSGTKDAHEGGRVLLEHLRSRFGRQVSGQVYIARPRPELVAQVGEPTGDEVPFIAHWADGDQELGRLIMTGLAPADVEALQAITPWLQPTVRRLAEAEQERAAVAEVVRRGRLWELKAEMLQLTQNPQSTEAFMRQVVGRLGELFAASQVLYWRYLADDDALEVRFRSHPQSAALEPPVSLGLFQEAVESRQVKTAGVTVGGQLKMFLLAPVFNEDMLEGVIQVVLPGVTLNQGVEEELSLASEYVAAGLKTVRFYEQLSYHASHDPLTGIANRRTFQQFLEREFRLSQRHGAPISMMILDVDHFKGYNDAFGHPAGDALLVRMARTLTEVVRATDFVARMGGEEFAIVLPHTDHEGALRVAQKVLEAVRQLHEGAENIARPVTASIGIASLPGEATTVDALVEAADKALYRAKHQGRDRAV